MPMAPAKLERKTDEGRERLRSVVREATSGGTRRRRRSLGCRRVMGALRTERSTVLCQAVESGAFALRGKSSTKVMAQPAAEWRVAV